jgi:malonyl-CoA/methylmalonyl-CoA synthetase
MQLLDLLDNSLVGQRDDIALEADGPDGDLVRWTFGELDDASNRVARYLERLNVKTGDRVCAYLPNSVEFLQLFLACLRLGAIFVPMNVLYRERELGHILADAAPSLVVSRTEVPGGAPSTVVVVSAVELVRESAGLSAAPVRRPLDGQTPAALVYTSGTTGKSKGAILSHDNLLANTVNLTSCWRITSADRYLAALPLFHVHGLGNGVLSWLASGCRMRLVERFEAARATTLFESFEPSLFFGVPTMYRRLLEIPADRARRIGAKMRLFVCGSAALPVAVLNEFRDRFGHTILERYGMSETLMLMSNPYATERRPGSVGFPLPGIAARIVDESGGIAGPGVVGELQVRGPVVFQGYWQNPAGTTEAFVDGWFRTGDLTERSADGYHTLRGRRSDLIISGGFNVYPREIEDVLLEISGVREAVVVGLPDERRGEVPVAYLVTDAPPDVEALAATCRRELASFKVPRGFVRVDALPRTALGKVQKHLLPPWVGP